VRGDGRQLRFRCINGRASGATDGGVTTVLGVVLAMLVSFEVLVARGALAEVGFCVGSVLGVWTTVGVVEVAHGSSVTPETVLLHMLH